MAIGPGRRADPELPLARAATAGANVIPQLRRVNKRSWNVGALARRKAGPAARIVGREDQGRRYMQQRSDPIAAESVTARIAGGGVRQLDRQAGDPLEHDADGRCRSLIQNAS